MMRITILIVVAATLYMKAFAAPSQTVKHESTHLESMEARVAQGHPHMTAVHISPYHQPHHNHNDQVIVHHHEYHHGVGPVVTYPHLIHHTPHNHHFAVNHHGILGGFNGHLDIHH